MTCDRSFNAVYVPVSIEVELDGGRVDSRDERQTYAVRSQR